MDILAGPLSGSKPSLVAEPYGARCRSAIRTSLGGCWPFAACLASGAGGLRETSIRDLTYGNFLVVAQFWLHFILDLHYVIGLCATSLSPPSASGLARGPLPPGDRASLASTSLPSTRQSGNWWYYITALFLTIGLASIWCYLPAFDLAIGLQHSLQSTTSLSLRRRTSGWLVVSMAEPPTGAGALPLQEYRREIPPGWVPGDPGYPLRLYFDRLRLWYRVTNLDDEIIGPLLAGRLYGKAGKIALALKVPRPDGTYDTGDAALGRLAVNEVRDPNTGALLQEHIPSGVQYLTDALKNAFGQMDQDLATQALEKFFNCTRGKMSLAEYSVEFETRLDEASDRAGLSLNNVGRFYLFFRGSGLSTKTIDDIKLQVGGDYNRFQEARQLALRLSPNRHNESADVFYEDSWDYNDDELYYDQDEWCDADDDGWWSYYEDGAWYGDDYGEDPWYDCYDNVRGLL